MVAEVAEVALVEEVADTLDGEICKPFSMK